MGVAFVGKVLITATVQSHIALFHSGLAAMLRANGYEVHVAAYNDLADKDGLALRHVDRVYEVCFCRSPFSIKNIGAFRQLRRIISENDYDIIHCNTPVGGILTRLAARKARWRGTKVIYTAHGFHFYGGAPLINWLLYYPVERWMAQYTDVLITINTEDYFRARGFKSGRVECVPGIGIHIDRINEVAVDREQKRKELGIPADAVVILSVGELINRKNHELALQALSAIGRGDVHYIICGTGVIEGYLRKLSSRLRIENQVSFLGFRKDVIEICKASDIFVFPSLQEGLPVALMEAMACGLPVVCSRIRGNVDLIEDEEGGYLCPANSVESFAEAISTLIERKQLRVVMGMRNKADIGFFDDMGVMCRLSEIYSLQFSNVGMKTCK